MDKKSLSILGCLFGGFFILLGVSFIINFQMLPFNFIGAIFIVVGYQFIKNRKINWMKKGYISADSSAAIRESGEKGEKEVAYALSWLDKDRKYIVINDITLQHEDRKQQFDHIVIGENGIFNIETKAYSGNITIDEDGNWTRENFGRKETLENPLFQSQRHHSILNSLLIGKFPIIDVIVLTRKEFTLTGTKNSPLNVIRVDVLQHYIENYTVEKTLSKDDIKEVEKIFLNSKVIKTHFTY